MDILYNIKRFVRNTRRVIKWIPRIWRSYDFDYCYAIDMFSYQLEHLADFLESDRAHAVGAKQRASRIRMVLRLMKKVYDEDYAMEYMDELERLYGKSDIAFIKTDERISYTDPLSGEAVDESAYRLTVKYEKDYTPEELEKIEKHKTELFHQSWRKQKRAHKLLWELIEHNIRDWWD